MNKSLLLLTASVVLGGAACEVDTIPDGLKKTPPGNGPVVRFDTSARPLPEVPLPNDFATFPDPTSRTGRRINVSLAAPTFMERKAREDFATMEGWGTSSPITVSFNRPPEADPSVPAIDLGDVLLRTRDDDHDLSNDPVYVINLTTGVPVFLDWGNGYFPVAVRDPWRYFPNDPKAAESNILFETVEEGAGLPQSAYRPELDKDFDGVLDHPNTFGKLGPRGIHGIDDLLTWYERETDTLVLRPILPLDEKTEYAVVLTDRLRGPSGEPVKSPFAAIHHPIQKEPLEKLVSVLREGGREAYYGNLSGSGLEHVAFAWTFTTQPTHEDMRLLRDGLYGKGPFARFEKEFPAELTALPAAGTGPAGEPQPAGWQTSSPACVRRAQTPVALRISDPDIRELLKEVTGELFGISAGEEAALLAAVDNVSHIVVGKFRSPFLMGDPASRDPDTRFHLDFKTGAGEVTTDDVSFLLVVPKVKGERRQPFPLATWVHGATGNSIEAVLFGGDFAKHGVATISFNSPAHGLVIGETEQRIAQNIFLSGCGAPFFGNLSGGRAHDINGDGKPDSGWYWWTSHIFHARDNLRQAILDSMQLTRIFRTFDGRKTAQDLNGNGQPDDVAGDFDGDGIPDVGGPNVPMFASGRSLGGIESQIQGGIDHNITATAPVAGGGSLALDVGTRSYGIVDAVVSQIMGPFVFAVPATERPSEKDPNDKMGTRCQPTERSVRFLLNEGPVNHEVEIACLRPEELAERMTVIVSNVTSGERRCARTGESGRFRIAVPTSINDRLDIQVYNAPDVVKSYDGCERLDGAPLGRRIQTFEQPALRELPAAEKTCTGDEDEQGVKRGCAQFRDVFYPVASPLVAPNDGVGLERQTPSLRRFVGLGQAAFDPADPVNYGAFYMMKPLVDPNGVVQKPHALLNINTVGDNFVQVSSGLSFARAAGALPFLTPRDLTRYPAYRDWVTPQELFDRLGGKTPMRVLIENGVAEGIARLLRTDGAGPSCAPNYTKGGELCTRTEVAEPFDCRAALYDADWVSEGLIPYDQPHPPSPLRLGRIAGLHATDATTLAAGWEPRLLGVPFSADENGWRANQPVIALLNHYFFLKGRHTWSQGDVCQKFDASTYGSALIGRFFATEGRDIFYLSHPRTHTCLANGTCDIYK